jgi:hypothetical protein
MSKLLEQLNNKKRGQSLLMVVVISTLSLLIMVSMADRILLTQVNVQRMAQFERAVAEAENKANQIISIVTDPNNTHVMNCLNTLSPLNSDFVELGCLGIDAASTRVFARLSRDPSVTLSENYPSVVLQLSQNLMSGVPTRSVGVQCSSNVQVLVTRVYTEDGKAKVEKGLVSNCNNNEQLVSFSAVPNNVGGSTTQQRNNTLYVRARLLNQTSGNVGVRLQVYGSQGQLVASTQKYEFIVTGIGGLTQDNVLGSDAIVAFERGAGQTILGMSSLLDYAYLETNQ